MPCELVAKDSVFGVVRAAADDVARVKIAHNKGDFSRIKPLFDLLAQKQTDVTQPDISRRIALISSISQQFLSCAFGNGNDCMPARHNPALQCSEKSTRTIQSERHFGDQREVHLLACHGSLGSQKSSVSSHELH